mgnify:FL=1
MKYHQKYMLLVNLPTGQKKGTLFHKRCDQNNELYWTQSDGLGGNKKGAPVFTLAQMEQAEFFEPVGEPMDLFLPFPDKMKIGEYYYLIGDSRLMNSVDQVRLIDPIFFSEEFYDAVYELLKKMYNEKYFPNHE